jgi:hypothetical protein
MNNQEITHKDEGGKESFKFTQRGYMWLNPETLKWSYCNPAFSLRSLADIKRIIELEKDKIKLRKSVLENYALVMANARRLIKANVRTSNGRLFSELFGTGFGTGRDSARSLGLNPDCNKTDYNQMRRHIDLEALKEPKP